MVPNFTCSISLCCIGVHCMAETNTTINRFSERKKTKFSQPKQIHQRSSRDLELGPNKIIYWFPVTCWWENGTERRKAKKYILWNSISEFPLRTWNKTCSATFFQSAAAQAKAKSCFAQRLQSVMNEKKKKRCVKESIQIRRNRPALDRDEGYELPAVFFHMVGSHDMTSHVTWLLASVAMSSLHWRRLCETAESYRYSHKKFCGRQLFY